MKQREGRRKRLCMVVHARYPVGEPRVQREALAARDAGYDVVVVCLRHAGESALEDVEGITVRRLPIEHVRGAGLVPTLVEYVRFALRATLYLVRLMVSDRFDVIQVHAPPDWLVVCGVIPRLLGSALVLDIHDLSPHMLTARFGKRRGSRALRKMLEAVQWSSCALTDAVVTVHDPYMRELVAEGVPARKVTTIMNSADARLLDRVKLTSAGARQDKREFTVSYHGTINQWYGVDLLVEAVSLLRDELPDMTGLVLGEGDALDDVRALAAELGVADRIVFSGAYLPIEEALAQVSQSSCGVIPNRPSELNRFALSSKLFEYVELGIPVVVSRLETLAAHFSDDEVVFFEPGSAEALAAGIARCAADHEESTRRAERARARAAAYAWSSNAARYVALLDALRRPRHAALPRSQAS